MNTDPFDYKAFERLKPQWDAQLFGWAAGHTNVTVDQLEFCEGGKGLKLKDGDVIARQQAGGWALTSNPRIVLSLM
jgi:hypothetical protein